MCWHPLGMASFEPLSAEVEDPPPHPPLQVDLCICCSKSESQAQRGVNARGIRVPGDGVLVALVCVSSVCRACRRNTDRRRRLRQYWVIAFLLRRREERWRLDGCDRNTHRCVGLGRFTGIRRAAVSREACVRVRVRVSWQSVGVVIAAGTRHRVAVAWCDED